MTEVPTVSVTPEPHVALTSARPLAAALRDRIGHHVALRRALVLIRQFATTWVLALLTVGGAELVAGKPFADTLTYFTNRGQPAMTITAIVFVVYLGVDAILARQHKSALILAPMVLFAAFVSGQKQVFLSDPLYPTDLLFWRQIVELMPALAAERPGTAALMAAGFLAGAGLLVALWVFAWRNFRRLRTRERLLRLALCIPVLAGFASIMDYNHWSLTRDRLRIYPILWDQTENYRHNGFVLAFLINLPMANVKAPAGYSAGAIDGIRADPAPFAATHDEKPDVIMVMSESLFDPTRIPGVTLTPDPMPTIRENSSGDVFSPEFGGMTSNVEFEALTGFSNAFLPAGSVPYQQYVRKSVPSLATFFRGQGYITRAIHPYEGWFWNRTSTYRAFGFDEFRDVKALPKLEMRGNFPSDEALTREIIRQAEEEKEPFFFFAVTLQGHGPYEVGRYPDPAIEVQGLRGAHERDVLATYSHGVKESDDALALLLDWARKRERETIVVFFGDHLPALGTVYTESGYMPFKTGARKAEPERMKREHETPLVIWSNRNGVRSDVGVISPALIPYHLVSEAGFEHPYYSGFLGKVAERYAVIDRYLLIDADGEATEDWARRPGIDAVIRDYRLLQYDIMFGDGRALDRFFPDHAKVAASAGA
jgi:Phosphoglycerol transferase and related proteins, alkaline phosphatase superfamily